MSVVQAMWDLDFMRNALVAGTCIALSSGLVGYFIVLRNQVFATDALSHVAFTGGMGGLLAGFNLVAGVFGGCVAVALAIGTLGGRGRGRDATIGTLFAWVLGVGVLFLSLYTRTRNGAGGSGIGVLFGSLLALGPQQVLAIFVATLMVGGSMLVLARPLLFATLDPDVAASRGVPVKLVEVAFMVVVGLAVAEAVQAVGALLIFALLVTPAATAQNLSMRPWRGMTLAAGIAVSVLVLGLLLAYLYPYPAGFFITAVAFTIYAASMVVRRLAAGRATR